MHRHLSPRVLARVAVCVLAPEVHLSWLVQLPESLHAVPEPEFPHVFPLRPLQQKHSALRAHDVLLQDPRKTPLPVLSGLLWWCRIPLVPAHRS